MEKPSHHRNWQKLQVRVSMSSPPGWLSWLICQDGAAKPVGNLEALSTVKGALVVAGVGLLGVRCGWGGRFSQPCSAMPQPELIHPPYLLPDQKRSPTSPCVRSMKMSASTSTVSTARCPPALCARSSGRTKTARWLPSLTCSRGRR